MRVLTAVFIDLFSDLKGTVEGQERERLIYSRNDFHGQGWAKLKSAAWNSIVVSYEL